ncbi:hypothetical protein [Nocardioides lianchengensis]|uniref:hypothetical protein n=1 Tax=Nocardioides lianchengensis TaxID=1045774 RepID=UPI001113E42D|nr:hypothetical protein [Nocardioides lianchengensis]NYG09630.1 hypothetical protein [Nocardioides lianchengensis]
MTKQDVTARAFRLNRGADGQTIWMLVSYRLAPDEEHEYLQVNSSVIALTADEGGASELLHFDYERDKADNYPEAHLQVVATSPAWEAVSPNRSLGRLHLPVGGRRFRFTLEDVAEFLLREEFVTPSSGASSVIDQHRAEFERNQLCAAIRRDPETAREFLNSLESGG